MLAIVLVLRCWQPDRTYAKVDAMESDPRDEAAPSEAAELRRVLAPRDVFVAWSPYLLLILAVLLWRWPPVAAALSTVSVDVRWPALHERVLRVAPVVDAPTPMPAVFVFNWLQAAGSAAFLSALAAAMLLGLAVANFVALCGKVVSQLALSLATIASVLGVAFVMNYSGMTGCLGLAFSASGPAFPFFSSLIGWFGLPPRTFLELSRKLP